MSASVLVIDSTGSQPLRPTAWQPGQSGNPAGRPKGSRNRALLAVEEMEDLLRADAAALGRELLALAKAGNTVALRLCMNRLMPAPRPRALNFEIEPIQTAADAARAHRDVLEAVAAGDLAPSEGLQVGRLIESRMKALDRAHGRGG